MDKKTCLRFILTHTGLGLTTTWLSQYLFRQRFSYEARQRRLRRKELAEAVRDSQTYEEWFEAMKADEAFGLKGRFLS
jgi:hypothetical protein